MPRSLLLPLLLLLLQLRAPHGSPTNSTAPDLHNGGVTFSSPEPWNLPVLPPRSAVPPVPPFVPHNASARPSATSTSTSTSTFADAAASSSPPGAYSKAIPRNLWIAVRDTEDKLPERISYQMPALFARNPEWTVYVCDNADKDRFMNTVFRDTSLLWAYHAINSKVRVFIVSIVYCLFALGCLLESYRD